MIGLGWRGMAGVGVCPECGPVLLSEADRPDRVEDIRISETLTVPIVIDRARSIECAHLGPRMHPHRFSNESVTVHPVIYLRIECRR